MKNAYPIFSLFAVTQNMKSRFVFQAVTSFYTLNLVEMVKTRAVENSGDINCKFRCSKIYVFRSRCKFPY